MDYKNYIITFCCFTVMSFMVNNILPDNKIKKYFTVCISVIFTVILCKPVTKLELKNLSSFDVFDSEDIYLETDDNNELLTANVIEQLIENNFGIENKCDIICEYSENQLNIYSIDVEVYEKSESEKIGEFIKNITGVSPKITVVEKTDE